MKQTSNLNKKRKATFITRKRRIYKYYIYGNYDHILYNCSNKNKE